MDGRLTDPTSPYFYKLLSEGFKNHFVSQGINFVRHYTNSPQCVPSRTGMMTSRYVHEIMSANNGQGLVRSGKTGKLDSNCIASWSTLDCEEMAKRQNVNATLLDALEAAGYDLHLFGRFDTGAGILDDYEDTTGDGFHGGPSIEILTRGSGLVGSQSNTPLSSTRATDPNPYSNDQYKTSLALNFLESNKPSSKPFFVHLGLLDPHPPYATNKTWESHVNLSSVDVPPSARIKYASMHPFDQFQATTKVMICICSKILLFA